MATNSSLEADFASFIIPLSGKFIPYLATAFMFMLLAYAVGDHGSKPEIPELNPSKPLEFTNRRRVNEFSRNSKQMLLKGKAQFGSNLHRLRCGWGEVFVVPPQVMHEVRNDPRLGAAEAQADDAHSYLPGFEPFSNEPALPKVITKYLTRALTKVTKALSEEATLVIREVLTDSTEWHQITPKEDTLQIVSRLSSRVFMGEELCRDEEWIRASKEYTAYFFPLLSELGLTPRWARPFVHWFRPDCWRLRSLQAECRRAMKPHLERRKALKMAALARGESLVFDDSIEWWEKERPKIIVDPAMQQITLSLVAIHTTADLLQQVMIDLALHPELFQPLREELVRVLSAEGLKKTALYNLKLMDSVCKETQRLKPVLLATFRRLVLEDIKMPNGWVFRKGEKIVTTNVNMWDSEYYENPLDYDGYRFLKMRSTEEEKSAHFVSTSEKHFGFGHGPHACPGRFFAANEVKIALAHLLLKYDWKLPEGADDPQPTSFGMMMVPDPNAVLLIRRRKEEIDLDSLET